MSQKYSKEICNRDHTGELPQSVLDALPEYQGHPVRHRCAACAYAAGVKEAAADVGKLTDKINELTTEIERLRAENADLRKEAAK